MEGKVYREALTSKWYIIPDFECVYIIWQLIKVIFQVKHASYSGT